MYLDTLTQLPTANQILLLPWNQYMNPILSLVAIDNLLIDIVRDYDEKFRENFKNWAKFQHLKFVWFWYLIFYMQEYFC